VAVYGTIPVGPSPLSTYSLDDSSLVDFSPPPATDAIIYQTIFYQSPPLLNGEHRLVVTYLGNNSECWIDYFLYLPSPTPASPATTSSAAGSAMANKINVGAIVGGVLGGLLFLALIALAYLWMRTRRPKDSDKTLEGE
jgi:hypothetical protein